MGKYYNIKQKRVTKKVHEQRKRMQEATIGLDKIRTEAYKNLKINNLKTPNTVEINGRRIVNINVLADNLVCSECKSILSLKNIISEKKNGLLSKFTVKCSNTTCNNVTTVCTDKTHKVQKVKVKKDQNSGELQ